MNKTTYFGFTAFLLTFSMAFETHFGYILAIAMLIIGIITTCKKEKN